MEVTLKYPATGSVTLSVDLPYPATSQTIDVQRNQKEHRAGARNLFTSKIGPTIYKVARVWEGLSDTEAAAIYTFLAGCQFARKKILFCYFDTRTGLTNEVPCRVIEDPLESIVHVNNRDVTLTFEQYTHPDHETDAD